MLTQNTFILQSNCATLDQIIDHFECCTFSPPLSHIVNIKDYSKKLILFSHRYELWIDEKLIGLIAVYENSPPEAYIPIVCVIDDYKGLGYGSKLLNYSLCEIERKGFKKVCLEVYNDNSIAFNMYLRYNFMPELVNDNKTLMCKYYDN